MDLPVPGSPAASGTAGLRLLEPEQSREARQQALPGRSRMRYSFPKVATHHTSRAGHPARLVNDAECLFWSSTSKDNSFD